MSTKLAADLLVRAATVRTMDPVAGPVTVMAIRDSEIAAIAGPEEEREQPFGSPGRRRSRKGGGIWSRPSPS
jgi:predicted amidohydrolase YtcJ